jgi:carboxylesterase type B
MEVELFIQKPISKPDLLENDTDCLNLSITVPSSEQRKGSKLPVFVWVHGGGFVVGAHSWPHYDHKRLVKLAADEGVPVIGVGIK